jgi:diguanylate cyclase (GGDEF)-like protein
MLASAVENSKRYNFPLSLGICDLDDFKQVNDQFGHQAGDGVLKEFGKIVREQFRRADFGGRYGGDEFLIVFPHTPAGGAGECLRRVRTSLEQVPFQFEDTSYRAACSAGVADKALYEAKRNRTGIEVKSPNGDE